MTAGLGALAKRTLPIFKKIMEAKGNLVLLNASAQVNAFDLNQMLAFLRGVTSPTDSQDVLYRFPAK